MAERPTKLASRRAGGVIAGPLRSSAGAGAWRSLEAVEFATLEWVDWFNHRRLLEPIGNVPPAEAEEHYYAQLQEIALAA
jgi:transposase InsO family protein